MGRVGRMGGGGGGEPGRRSLGMMQWLHKECWCVAASVSKAAQAQRCLGSTSSFNEHRLGSFQAQVLG